jgi:HEAT repeat protein
MRNRQRATIAVVAACTAAAVLVGCAGGGGASRSDEALDVLRAAAAENNDQHTYVLDVASRSSAPATGALLLEGAAERAYEVSSAALHALAERPVDGGATALAPVFAEKRGALKITAAMALARQGDADAVAWLEEQLTDANRPPGAEVALAVHRAGNEEAARTFLAAALGSDDERRRDDACLVLGEIGTDWAKELLVQGLDNERGERRQTAIVGLGMVGDPALTSRILKFINTQGLVTATIEALGRMGGEKAVKNLRGALKHDEALVRAYAVEALLRTGTDDETVRGAASGLAGDEDPDVRQLLALRLGGVEHPYAREVLAGLAGDTERGVRLEAVRGLLKGVQPGEIEVLKRAAGDADYQVQAVALEALGRVAGPDAVAEAVEPYLTAENPYVRIAAHFALIEIDSRAASGT